MEWLSRTELLIGKEGVERLRSVHAAVVGLGGVGGAAAWALCRSGVGKITLIDFDRVSESNLNRQMVALSGNIGLPKTEAAAAMLRAVNPNIELVCKDRRVTRDNLSELLGDAAYVADCIDDVPAKCALIAHCTEQNVQIVSSMGAGNRLDASAFRVMDIYDTSYDGLARAVRGRLRKLGVQKLDVVCSVEAPIRAGVQEDGRRSPGSISFVPPAAGLVLAGELVRKILAM